MIIIFGEIMVALMTGRNASPNRIGQGATFALQHLPDRVGFLASQEFLLSIGQAWSAARSRALHSVNFENEFFRQLHFLATCFFIYTTALYTFKWVNFASESSGPAI